MVAYYNDNDPFVCAWLRELIKAGLIAPGEVDERSIEEVKPGDLRGFAQCHFFAGIGVWPYALRAAGWPDDLAVWTGSCPCQGFSASGKREGFSDKRHLWPAWFRLIRERAPDTIFGEQVSAKDGLAWFDVVSADLENEGYAIGALDTCAASVGAPHVRQRLFFVADSQREQLRASGSGGIAATAREVPTGNREWERLRDDTRKRSPIIIGSNSETAEVWTRLSQVQTRFRKDAPNGPRNSREPVERANADGRDSSTERLQRGGEHGLRAEDSQSRDGEYTEQSGLEGLAGNVKEWRGPGWLDPITARSVAAAGTTRGYWSNCDWWFGRDGKYRPIGTGLFPLVNGASRRMGKLRGYGNALVAPQAQAFIEAYMSLERGL